MPIANEPVLVASSDAFDLLASEWALFPEARDNPLLDPLWFRAAQSAVAGAVRIFTVRRDGQLVALAPLAEESRLGTRRLGFIGASLLYHPGGLIASDTPALESLCESIVALRLPVALLRIEQQGAAVRAFTAACRGHGRLFVVPSPPTLQVDLRGGWDAYLATRSAKLLADVRRKIRRLESTGKVELEFLRPTPEGLDRVLEEAMDVEADGWKGEKGSALRHNTPIRRFVCALASLFAATGHLRVNFLRVNGTAVAMCIVIEHGGRLWGVKRGYRESSGPFSPGKILLHETLRNICERGLDGYEFLGSGDPMQPAWATGERPLQSLVYYPYSFQGVLAFAGDVASLPIRRLARLIGR